MQQAPRTEGLKPQKCTVSQPGSQRSEVKVWAGLAPSEAVTGNLFLASPWLLTVS